PENYELHPNISYPMSSQPEPGLYHIYSRVLSKDGDKLAMTSHGDNQPITVTPLLDYSNPAQH
ncbi:hypothetical protein FRC09_015260, partial [Ceratobasidium sp. 395]